MGLREGQLLDRRERARVYPGWTGGRQLYLKRSRVETPEQEQSPFDGLG